MNSPNVAVAGGKRHDVNSPARPNERRLRHEVSISASIVTQRGAPFECEIQDISSTGMGVFMQFLVPDKKGDPLAVGCEACIVFAPDPENAPADTVTLPVQIMWRCPQRVGFRYLEQNAQLRAALAMVARRAVGARNNASAEQDTFSPREQRSIIGAIRKTLDKLLPNIIWSMRTDVSRRLRLFAEDAGPGEAAKARADADLVDLKSNAITRTIEVRFFRSFAAAVDFQQTLEVEFADIAPDIYAGAEEKLDVVGEQVVEHESIITALAHHAEERYKSTLFELNVRLKDVAGHRMDNNSNPLIPTAAYHIFWTAVIEFCDSELVRRHLQGAITARIAPLLGELYEALHETLDAHGVPRPFEG